VNEAESLAPRFDEQGHEVPLQAVRVLELVHEHVVIARLEPVAALGELVHLAQQLHGARDQLGEVHHVVLRQDAAVALDGEREQPVHAAREDHVHVAGPRGERVAHRWRRRGEGPAVPLERRGRRRIVAPVAVRTGPRLPLLRQEVGADRCGQGGQQARVPDLAGIDRAQIGGHNREARVAARAVGQEGRQAVGHRSDRVAQAGRGERGRPVDVEPGGRAAEIASQPFGDGEPPVHEVREPVAQAGRRDPRQHQRHVFVVAGQSARHPQRLVEGGVHEARRLGLVRNPEAGVEPRLERELAQQREAERVDRGNGHLADAIAQRQPAGAAVLAPCGGLPQRRDDPLAHLGRGLAGEGHREDVRGIDAGGQQVQVALHQHRRLARPRRRLEHDVQPRIGSIRTCGTIAFERVARLELVIRHHARNSYLATRHSPSST
jgi:hypothetical protein